MDEQERELVTRYFKNKPPNPERTGCPDKSVLTELAQGRLPASSPWYSHMTNCPECWGEAETLRQQHLRRKALGWRWAALGTAAALALLVAGLRWEARPSATAKNAPPQVSRDNSTGSEPRESRPIRPSPPEPQLPTKSKVPNTLVAVATLDLTAFSVVRGGETSPTSVSLRSVQGKLRVILPPVSEPGQYQARLLDRDLKAVWESTGSAVLIRGRAILEVVLDVRVAPGAYNLALQCRDEEWHLYPVEVIQ